MQRTNDSILKEICAKGQRCDTEYIRSGKEYMVMITGRGIEKPVLGFGPTEEEAMKAALYMYMMRFPA